jgi:hypothetical protein|tara:strand:+ start:671 stop:1045 length:375 start_codon:yes stop_codon:yes gene_type:complete
MPRPKRKEIKLTHESAVSLMQEIYNESVEQRSTAIRIQNKMIGFMKEATDMALIGPVLKEQQKIIDSSIDKKLQLSKLLANIVSKNMEDTQSPHSLGEDIKESINQLLTQSKDGDGDNSINYKM